MALLPPENVRKLRARMGGFALAAMRDPLPGCDGLGEAVCFRTWALKATGILR